jgi:hypothetical protein
MSVFTPEYKLSINGVEYTDVAISDIAHQAGREDIYAQPTPSYIQIALVALNNENYNFQVNDGIALQVKDSTNVFRTLFGGNITVYNIASLIADSAFGVLYEDNEGRIGYADALHRQNYLANNGYTEISANTAFGAGLKVLTRGADVRNDVFLNYGNNFGSQVSAIDLDSIEVFGYRGETINTVLHDATDAQSVADRFISLRSYPRALFDSITFPLTNSAIDDADRDALLGIFVGQPMRITDLPVQIAPTQQFEGYVEGWRWSTRFNELFLTINLSPIEFSQVAVQWEQVSASEEWDTLSGTLTWENAIGAVA